MVSEQRIDQIKRAFASLPSVSAAIEKFPHLASAFHFVRPVDFYETGTRIRMSAQERSFILSKLPSVEVAVNVFRQLVAECQVDSTDDNELSETQLLQRLNEELSSVEQLWLGNRCHLFHYVKDLNDYDHNAAKELILKVLSKQEEQEVEPGEQPVKTFEKVSLRELPRKFSVQNEKNILQLLNELVTQRFKGEGDIGIEYEEVKLSRSSYTEKKEFQYDLYLNNVYLSSSDKERNKKTAKIRAAIRAYDKLIKP